MVFGSSLAGRNEGDLGTPRQITPITVHAVRGPCGPWRRGPHGANSQPFELGNSLLTSFSFAHYSC
eukprot:5042023-Prymnesium_polylepis.1